MEIKKGNNSYSVPGWVIAAGIATVGTIIGNICKTIEETHK